MPGLSSLRLANRGAVDRADERTAEAGPGLGESVDGLDHPGVGGVVEAIEPFADLVGDIDLPLAHVHSHSIAFGIQAGQDLLRQLVRLERPDAICRP